MMSIHRKLTIKYLLHNKKRTIFTILGIMMSIALMTAIGTFLFSMQDYTIKQTKREYGSYHLKIKNANSQTKKRLEANPQIDRIGVSSKKVFFLENGRQIDINIINQDTYSLLPFAPVSNRNKQGLIIEQWVAADLERIGDTTQRLSLNDASGLKQSFHVQRIVENNKALHGDQTLQAFLIQTDVKDDKGIDLYVELAEGAEYQAVYDQISTHFSKDRIEINYPLVGVEYSDNESFLINSIIYILPICIVVLATVAFIFNTFQISIAERIRDITLLRTIGATKKQIKKMIVFEMWIFGCIGIPIGLIFGFFGYWLVLVLYKLIFEETEFSLFYFPIIFSPVIMLISSLIGVIALVISGWLPLKIANRIGPLDSVRRSNRRNLKVKGFYRLIEKFLSIETVMAMRNIRRNKLKSIIVIFSLSISIFLFTAFSNIVLTLFQSEMDNNDLDFSIGFYQSEEMPATFWKDLNEISEIEEKRIHYADESTPLSIGYIYIYLKDEDEVNKVQKKLDQITAPYPNLEVVNVLENMKNQSSLQVQILIYLYGFAIAIAIIGVLNIINTSSMNVILRKKEYATLKAIGMSLKDLRKMIIREGLLYAFISGFIGISLAVSIELLLYLSSGIGNWSRNFIQNSAAFMSLLIICYLSARFSSRIMTNKEWNDALKNE